MATSKVTNCFSKISVKEFDTIEGAAQKLAESKGRAQPINADYAEVVRGIIGAKQAKLDALLKPQMSSNSKGAGRQNTGNTAANVVDAITSWMRVSADRLSNKVTVVQTMEDLKGKVSDATYSVLVADLMDGGKAVAFTMNGHAYIIADRVQKGQERALFIHEVGAHLGLERLLPEKLYKHLVAQLQSWAAKEDGSVESKLAKRALERANEAETSAEDMDSEHLAYFLEEAIKAGIDPVAAKGSFGEWLRSVYAAMKAAFRKLTGSTAELSPQDIVNLAYGAARLEVGGTWHGTAANFRKFDHSYMGSGEGAQAYGWGTYMAEKRDVAQEYFKDDITRKAGQSLTVYGNKLDMSDPNKAWDSIDALLLWENPNVDRNVLARVGELLVHSFNTSKEEAASIIRSEFSGKDQTDGLGILRNVEYGSAPEGSLMRNDHTVHDTELLDWDKPINQQRKPVIAALEDVKQRLDNAGELENFEDNAGDYENWTGADLVKRILPKMLEDGLLPEEFDAGLGTKQGEKKAISEYLDSIGIKGSTHLDQFSRHAKTHEYATEADIGYPAKGHFVISRDTTGKIVHTASYSTEEDARKKAAERNAREVKPTRNHVIFNDKNIIRVATHPGADTGRIKFSKATPEQAKQAAAEKAKQEELLKDAVTNFPVAGPVSRPPQQLTKLISALPTSWRDPAMHVARVLTGKTGDAINAIAFTTDLIDRAVKLGMASAKKYMELHNKQSAMVGQHERKIQDISAQYMGIEEENKGVGKGTANQFLHDSTMSRKWGYDVEFTTTDEKGNAVVKKIQADPEMAKQFNALKPKAQAYVKAVFAYGREALQAKQQAVMDSVPSIYDSLIADETDPKLKQELIDAKASQIKQFGSLYRISGDTPYAPLKRFGKWIVVARSKELASLIAKFDTMQQGSEKEIVRKMIRKMEGESIHQFNDHFDNESEARTVEDKLAQLPQFQNGVVHTRERNEASLFEGSGTLNALRAIEAKLQDTPDGNHKRKMLRMVGDMYLSALSEDSARKNEMERLGVKADDPVTGNTRIDMQRAFESQGKADAFFLAHAAVGRDMQAVFKQMQKESNAGGDTRAKSSLYNELMLRRIQSLNYEDENWSHKVVRMASKYMLAFSPAYYMQNATQPWMVSLPVMAGRHEFGKTANVLAGKYSQIAEAVKNAQLLGNLDYNKILDGISDTNERAFLKRALDEGIIDIGHGIELAANSHYDSKFSRAWGKVDQSIRNLQQKAEAINRITTALTAYELEMGKTGDVKAAEDYAERIVRETHGDYSAWNAPRAFNTNLGRVALQFRKYQLVQLTLMARLLKNTFAGASKEERAMAMKAFGLMVGQAALVGGGKALPMLAVVPALMAGAFGNGGDEPPEYLFRQWIGNKDVSDILLNGLPSKLTGMNLSKFGGMGQMLDILPFQNGLLPTDRSSMESFGYAVLGGPFGGLTLRAADGATNIANGMWWKGIESFVPTGFANVSKAVRYGVEGDENKRGTLNLAKEEFNAFTLAAQAMGIQPGVVERRMYEQQTKYAIDTAFKDHANRLKAEYVRASRDGDSAAMADVRNKWMKMQEGQRADGIQPNPLSTLIKAPMEARKSEQQRQGTQVYGKKEREFGGRVANY